MNRLVIDVGVSTRPGNRYDGGSSSAMERVAPEDTPYYGALLAVSELAGRSEDEPEKSVLSCFKQEFLEVPEYWSVEEAMRTAFAKANRSIRSDVYNRHVVALSAAVILGTHLFIGHAGNNRIWLYRDGRLQQLTSDHTRPRMNQDPILTRACGIENEVDMDFRCIDLREGDVVIMANHETHSLLDGSTIVSSLLNQLDAGRMAEAITRTALNQGAQSRVSIIVARVDRLPGVNGNVGITRRFPAAGALPADGQTLDGFRVLKRRRKGRLSHFYNATDLLDDSPVMLKFADPGFMHGQELADCFVRDEWLCHQVSHPAVVSPVAVGRGRRSALYSVLQPARGENLLHRVARKGKLSLGEVRLIAGQLLGFLEYLHQQHIIHRDIRPENILLDKKSKTIHVLGFDSHRIRYWLKQGPETALQALNPRYLAPESFRESGGDARIDIYGAGVTLYHLLSGKLPYGNLLSLDRLDTLRYRPLDRYNDALPKTVAEAIATACALPPERRFAGATEFLDALSGD